MKRQKFYAFVVAFLFLAGHPVYIEYGKEGFLLIIFGEPSGTRTPDTLIKSQVLYQLS